MYCVICHDYVDKGIKFNGYIIRIDNKLYPLHRPFDAIID